MIKSTNPTERYKNRYNPKSLRLQNWDYAQNAAYFITICTQHHIHYFGNIENNCMILSPLGIIADILWYEIKNHAKHTELAEFIVMPNHIHGILILNNPESPVSVETRHALSLQKTQNNQTTQSIGKQRFQNQGKNTISSIIGSYKSAVTKHTHRLGFDFQWQRNFWEHIIRDENEYYQIAQYIIENPIKWENDKLNNGVGKREFDVRIKK
jgi:putative transposase